MLTRCYAHLSTRPRAPAARWLVCGAWLALVPLAASSWEVNLGNAQRRLFLHVGAGVLNADSGTVSQFEVTVPGPQLGNGPLPMTTANGQTTSLRPLCPPSGRRTQRSASSGEAPPHCGQPYKNHPSTNAECVSSS